MRQIGVPRETRCALNFMGLILYRLNIGLNPLGLRLCFDSLFFLQFGDMMVGQ